MRIVGGKFRGRALKTPDGQAIRPTADRVRESIFNILASRLSNDFSGLHVLDLFAGTGGMALEALSRGATGAVLVDTDTEARGLIRDNIEALGVAGVAKLLRRDATELGPAGTMGPFGLVFADPPYGRALGERALASAMAGGWIAADATIVLEDSAVAEIAPPEGFVIEDRRVYGAAAIHILALA